jgi:hypothetical protein
LSIAALRVTVMIIGGPAGRAVGGA